MQESRAALARRTRKKELRTMHRATGLLELDGSKMRRRVLLVCLCTFVAVFCRVAFAAVQNDAAGQDQAPPPGETSNLWWFIATSGVIGAGLILLSIYFIATVGKLFVELRHQVAMPPQVLQQCEELLQKKEFMSIYNLLKTDKSFFSRVLFAGISELPNGMSEAREAMSGVTEAITVSMEKKISILAVLGTLGPMIGLLGTLKGMMSSFSAIAMHDRQLNASEVAKGISEALLLTFEGVALSVPAIYFFSVFKNRVATISVDTLLKADEFLRHFGLATRKKPGTTGSAS
jgi:biopolymer transport protein ExbB